MLRNIIVIFSGTVLAQLINFAASPILTRLYSPEAFGLLGLFLAGVSILSTVASGRYEMAIMVSHEESEARTLLGLSCALALCFSVCIWLVSPLHDWIAATVGSPGLAKLLPFLPVAVACAGIAGAMEYWLARSKKFNAIAKSAVAAALVSSGLMLCGGLWSGNVLALLAGSVAMYLVRIIWMSRSSNGPAAAERYPSWNELKVAARKHRNFPRYRSTQDFLNAISQNLPGLALGYFFGPVFVGYFWLANRVMMMPVGLVSESVRKVYYQQSSELLRNGKPLFPGLCKSTFALVGIAIVPMAVAALYAKELFTLVFGGGWQAAGMLAQWMSIWVFFAFINVPAVVVLSTLGRLRFSLYFQIFSTIARLLAVALAAYVSNDAVVTIATFSTTSAILNFLLILSAFWFCSDADSCLLHNAKEARLQN